MNNRRPTLTPAERAELDAFVEAENNRTPLYSPAPDVLPEGVVHFAPAASPNGKQFAKPTGWFYTSYNPETREGEGWFGSADYLAYQFQDALREDEYGETVLMSRNCGYSEGCFWTEWR